jgi:UDP-2-acetamido-3-amino-2,3-dideoxy-glucuronate N-acetyltransferase
VVPQALQKVVPQAFGSGGYGLIVSRLTLPQRICMPVESDVRLGSGVIIFHPELVNLYGCQIGDGTRIGTFVEIQKNALIGKNCKISSHSFICEGVEIEDEVFIGHGVKFINDLYPRAATAEGNLQGEGDWKVLRTLVRARASIGTNATILPNLSIGRSAMIGAAALVAADVPDYAIAAGSPARIIGDVRERQKPR